MPKTKLPFEGWDLFRIDEELPPELDQQLAHQREIYSNALDTMMDKTAEAYEDGQTAQLPIQDMAVFAAFLGAVKMVELTGQPMSKRAILGAVNFLIHRMQDELPEMAKQLTAATNSFEAGHA